MDKGRIRTFVLGGIAGAVAGILLAPRSGKELRGSIASRAGEARERGRETYFEAQERARERFSEARDRQPRTPWTEDPAKPEASLGQGPSPTFEEPAGVPPPGRPPLRDVSRDMPWDAPAEPQGSEEDAEELRRGIREARSRLRERLERPEEPSGKGEG